MNNFSHIELAKNYVTLSNLHDLARIQPLFAADATYHSAFFGEFQGRDIIYSMMAGFFTRFPDAHWEVSGYREIENNGVEFAFTMTGSDTESGKKVERHGLERIFFTIEGLIRHIAVDKPADNSE
ncbi:nuclear transport factor 2 family protein [Nitrosomonas sp.]|uniref:nuclear transport factor 2 family protein n=1 Tax=Nitrosomonas sp. TaxID=42353 RepID=UPI001DE2E8EE|nr:nuclear transport factor 2 family protein [Nitrosomonas sp.]MBX3615682.1 nuclear transport factor 2 family protein [Nitrosomonas sp.]